MKKVRQEAYADRMTAKGFIRARAWIPASKSAELKETAAKWRSEHLNKKVKK